MKTMKFILLAAMIAATSSTASAKGVFPDDNNPSNSNSTCAEVRASIPKPPQPVTLDAYKVCKDKWQEKQNVVCLKFGYKVVFGKHFTLKEVCGKSPRQYQEILD